MTNVLIAPGINSLADMVEKSLHDYADKPAFSCLGQTLTFAQIDEKSRALGCYLQQKIKLKAGDVIVIQLPNLTQYPIAVYAALRIGLIIVNTNPLYTPREMQHQFKDSGAKALIILADLLPKFEGIQTETDIETVIVTSAADLMTNDIAEQGVNGHICFNHAIAQGAPLILKPRQYDNLDAPCLLQYTGGTTGVSKGAVLTHRNILSNRGQTLERIFAYCQPGKEIFICPLPVYHIYAFTVNLMIFFSRGNLNVLIPNPRDMDAFVKAIRPFKFTGFSGINTLFVGLCQHPEFSIVDFSKLKLTLSGGTALTLSASETWKKVTGCTITEGYGLSETSPVLCLNQPGKEQIGTVGKPVSETEIQLRVDDKDVADGEEGEIVVKGPQIMPEYWQRPEETMNVMTSDGFFRTGDIGVRLPSGNIKIVDRLKDMIIVSGFNVYPNEVEGILVQHPKVVEAAVIGEHDEKSGEAVCCFITVSGPVSPDEIITHCQKSLTGYKVPKKVTIVDELPKSTVGKILRKELRSR